MKRVVLISGGSSGLGLATTKAFLEKDDTVIVASRSEDKFSANLDTSATNLHFIQTDFNDMNAVKQLHEKITSDFGTLDVAINNVGTASLKPFTLYTEADFDQTINVNLKSLWLSMKLQIEMMTKDSENHKHIINVASINGLGGAEYLSLYAAAKAGVISLTKSAALELAKSNISINTIVPGPFETPMLNTALDQQAQGDDEKRKAIEAQYKQFIPKGRFGIPEEFAKTALWICEGDATFMSGHSFIIDGGMSSRFR